jgi:hypothetical protein
MTLFYLKKIVFYMKMSSLALLLCFVSANVNAQKNKKQPKADRPVEYFDEKHTVYQNKVYDDDIHTVIIHNRGSELDWPIISLAGMEKIILRFDDLSDDVRELSYTFEHCTHDWKKSDLLPMDYLEGFRQDIIQTYDFSFNTTLSYTHFMLEFPNERMKFTRSGNYIIKVFANGDQEDLLLTARFMVIENRSTIEPNVRPSSVVSERDYMQEVDLSVSLNGIQVMNPYNDIELVVLQNFRWDNAKRGVKPSFIKDNKLIYDYQGELSFDGTNEFRFFDAKSLRYRSEQVKEVIREADGYHIILTPDMKRSHLIYEFQNDINGRLLIKNDDMQNAHVESDYVTIHFSMPTDAMLGHGDMYLFGQLSQWELDKKFRLDYNAETSQFEKKLMLKQGYYNYLYLWKPLVAREAHTDFTEGNHSQTHNEYIVLIYYKDQSTFSDRLIGFKLFNSFNN